MDISNIEMVTSFLVMIGVTLCAVIAVYWIWILATSRRVKTSRMKMSKNVMELKGEIGQPFLSAFIGIIGNLTDETRCIHCGAVMPDHYHGCPFAAQWQLVTIAKPGG